jgi:hypothetical protein
VEPVSDQEIDTALRVIQEKDRTHRLTPPESSLLQLLARCRCPAGAGESGHEPTAAANRGKGWRTWTVNSSTRWFFAAYLLLGMAFGYCLWTVIFSSEPQPSDPGRFGRLDVSRMSEVERRRVERIYALRAHWPRRRTEALRLAREVIAGRQTLFEAAANFDALDRQRPDYAAHRRWLRETRPGKSYEEYLCTHVIQTIEELAASEPRLADVARRLEHDLAARLARGGRLRLPGITPDDGPEGPATGDGIRRPA